MAFLVLLAIIDRPAAALAASQPWRLSRWRLPLLGVRSRTADHRITSFYAGPSSDCRGGEPSGDRQGDRDEAVITEEKLDNLGPRDREMLRSILELDVTTTREKTVPSWILLWSNYTAPCPHHKISRRVTEVTFITSVPGQQGQSITEN